MLPLRSASGQPLHAQGLTVTKNEMSESEIARWIVEYIEGADNPDLRAYGSRLLKAAKSFDRYFHRFYWFAQYLIRLGQMSHSRVLDVGCGFGWDAATISMLGRNEIVANDIRETMTAPLRDRIEALSVEGAPLNVSTLTGDICTLNVSPDSFDAVYCREAIEHIHDLDALFAKIAEVLRRGGRCVVANDSNAFSRALRADFAYMWTRRDASWDYIEELKRERPIENKNIEPYAVTRERLLRAANPTLGMKQIDELTGATAGLVQQDIELLAREYREGQSLPIPPAMSWCRDPVTGEYCERLLNPYEICEIMRRHGFVVRLRHAFRRFPLWWLNRTSPRLVSRLLFNRFPLFVVVGEKR